MDLDNYSILMVSGCKTAGEVIAMRLNDQKELNVRK